MAVYLWRPTKHGLLYAQMDQLPSREPVTPQSRGIELNQRVASAADDEDSLPFEASLATSLSTNSKIASM